MPDARVYSLDLARARSLYLRASALLARSVRLLALAQTGRR